ncbi:MAG TPA: AMMECR1 domain-containing protein [Polyangiaceae bacterium]|jgi:AMMECR1 domain-containing protein
MSPAFPLAELPAPIDSAQRQTLRSGLRQLLEWQRDLSAWPKLDTAPDATPIVSLYVRGRLCGCAGMSDGQPAERLARAFVQALGDGRFGGISGEARGELVCQVSYVRSAEAIPLEGATDLIEVGSHGLALVPSTGMPATLLPDVAGEHQLDAAGLLEALEHKSGLPRAEWPRDGLFTFQSEHVSASLAPEPELARDPLEAAAGFLERQVDADGHMWFGFTPRTGERVDESPMLHGRIAVAVRALLSQSAGRGAAVRARRWLGAELVEGLRGQKVRGFPEDPAMVAGTLALSALAGLDVQGPLLAWAARPELATNPWHAAQVVAALGARAPAALWEACVRDIEARPWAPWTLLAAHARGDTATLARCAELLIEAVRAHAPHRGGVGPGAVPELARTAATVEALRVVDSSRARSACELARDFLRKHQLFAERSLTARDPSLVHGAFPQSPVHDFLQIDVTGHALLALAS